MLRPFPRPSLVRRPRLVLIACGVLVLAAAAAAAEKAAPSTPTHVTAASPVFASAPAVEPKIYLSWGAPWGLPGARDRLDVTADTSRTDTLYLSFDPGDEAPGFCGLTGVLYFWPQPGDTVGSFWHFQRSAANSMALRLDFEASPFDGLSPWGSAGMGMPRYEFTAQSGRLSFIYAIPATEARALQPGKIYALARVMISHRRGGLLAGHRQPMCIEWGDANLALSQEVQVDVQSGPGSVVSWASRDGKACEGFGRTRGAATLDPKERGWNSMPSLSLPSMPGRPDTTTRR